MKLVKVVSILMFDACLNRNQFFIVNGKRLSPRFVERWTYRYINKLIKERRLEVEE